MSMYVRAVIGKDIHKYHTTNILANATVSSKVYIPEKLARADFIIHKGFAAREKRKPYTYATPLL